MSHREDGLKNAIGLMSGTSMDGIDVALLRTDGEAIVERGPSAGYSYDPAFRADLKEALDIAAPLADRNVRPDRLAVIERDLTLRHAAAVREFLGKNAIDPASVDLIGFHGQTVLHRPRQGLTIQIGDGGLLASETGIDVMFDLRANDMVHGGQGAPLVPAYHAALARGLDGWNGKPVAFINIGGISNLTAIGADGTIIACDSGPGNTLIDQWVESLAGIPYDAGGAIASEGVIDASMVARYLSHPFFNDPSVTSLDRNDFRPPEADEIGLHDGARTLARVTAEAIIATLRRRLDTMPALLVICGGGRLNRTIMADLAELAARFQGVVEPAEAFGLNGDSMEAEAWAFLAVRAAKGLPITFPGTTGVKAPVSGGVLAKAPERSKKR